MCDFKLHFAFIAFCLAVEWEFVGTFEMDELEQLPIKYKVTKRSQDKTHIYFACRSRRVYINDNFRMKAVL